MKYTKVAKEYGIKLIWCSEQLANGGYNTDQGFGEYPNGVIFLQDNLSDELTEDVFNHEIGQLLDGSPITKFSAPSLHLESERKANEYMIREKIVNWFNSLTVVPDFIPVDNVMRSLGIDPKLRDITEEEIREEMSRFY